MICAGKVKFRQKGLGNGVLNENRTCKKGEHVLQCLGLLGDIRIRMNTFESMGRDG